MPRPVSALPSLARGLEPRRLVRGNPSRVGRDGRGTGGPLLGGRAPVPAPLAASIVPAERRRGQDRPSPPRLHILMALAVRDAWRAPRQRASHRPLGLPATGLPPGGGLPGGRRAGGQITKVHCRIRRAGRRRGLRRCMTTQGPDWISHRAINISSKCRGRDTTARRGQHRRSPQGIGQC
jgi:hypothetical protein